LPVPWLGAPGLVGPVVPDPEVPPLDGLLAVPALDAPPPAPPPADPPPPPDCAKAALPVSSIARTTGMLGRCVMVLLRV
jgi:hypothetical protein